MNFLKEVKCSCGFRIVACIQSKVCVRLVCESIFFKKSIMRQPGLDNEDIEARDNEAVVQCCYSVTLLSVLKVRNAVQQLVLHPLLSMVFHWTWILEVENVAVDFNGEAGVIDDKEYAGSEEAGGLLQTAGGMEEPIWAETNGKVHWGWGQWVPKSASNAVLA
ncbi:uncharacterized protein LOC124161987 isoform X2 [Ischnura elegans]|uniref:uncharacterized protein LOC124161987 isoform X2 n=1 Tax=Ischnura elegans TaxID=197161 RepID=UPI001ED87F2D|nr:uncharacterized protein LOC124161987 isoform X2 [Ischnura elegans]